MNQQVPTVPCIKLKAYSISELAALYECSDKTMKTWLSEIGEEIGPRKGHFYTPRQMKVIFTELGIPGMMYQE
ncbi:MAG TPA: hypothetical protein VK783_09715 [Bacteroidia bacterium]|nr:hypothetical protein [Bacteroidia bacterium]